jgi:hypothetical protein
MGLLTYLALGVFLALTVYFARKAYGLQREVVNLRVATAFNMNLDTQAAIASKQEAAIRNAKLAGLFFLPFLIYVIGTTIISIGFAVLISYVFYRVIRR